MKIRNLQPFIVIIVQAPQAGFAGIKGLSAQSSGLAPTTGDSAAKAPEPGESMDVIIYEQMGQGVDVKAQNTGKILCQNWADNTASPPHLHA
jgi:hypothetical protein